MFEDRYLTCRDCGEEFVFSASEQEFYAEKGFTNDPGRCPSCRAARKRSNNGYRQKRQMYPVVCAECGKDTEVPFQPTGERPVYCSECFRQRQSY
ncbi:MAG: zinc-binding protein [Peptococcaceae bacterium]|nr:zinc-binding protein [Candidatus Syntrophopropionicum ammoniitolerans]